MIIKLFTGIVAIALALSFVGGAAAATSDGLSPATAIDLVGTQNGSSLGQSSGAFDYYTVDYPGKGVVATVSLTFWPNDPTTANAIGMNAYQGGTLLAKMNGIGNPPGTHVLSFSSPTAGPVLVQFYNYAPGVQVGYQVTLGGITPPPLSTTSTAASPAAPAVSSPAESGGLTGPTSGTLAGNIAGTYAYYTIFASNTGVAQAVHLWFSPNYGYVAGGVYVVVYQNGTKIGFAHGANASPAGSLTTWYIPNTIGSVLIQIGNYTPNVTIGYSISL
jgi:hypothetical protein